jgi:hypothetical protein
MRVLALVPLLAASIFLGTPSEAKASCDTGRASNQNQWHVYNRHSNLWSGELAPRAIQAHEQEYHPFIESIGRWTNSSVMVGHIQPNGTQIYAQTGWKEDWGIFGLHYVFVEYTNAAGARTFIQTNINPGNGTSFYQAGWYNEPGNGQHTFRMYWNGNLLVAVVKDWSPSLSQALSETYSDDSQMSGDTSDRMDFTQLYDSINGSWIVHAGTTTNENSNFFGKYKPALDKFQTWDNAC